MRVIVDKLLNNPVLALAVIQALVLVALVPVVPEIAAAVTAVIEVVKREFVTPTRKAKRRA